MDQTKGDQLEIPKKPEMGPNTQQSVQTPKPQNTLLDTEQLDTD